MAYIVVQMSESSRYRTTVLQFARSAATIGVALLLVVLVGSCSSPPTTRPAITDRDSLGTAEELDSTSTISEIVTGPETAPPDSVNLQPPTVTLTIGERLKQLDSLMTIAPTDSLSVLMEEYDRLLDSTLVARGVPAQESVLEDSPDTVVTEIRKILVSEPPPNVSPSGPTPPMLPEFTSVFATDSTKAPEAAISPVFLHFLRWICFPS